jgi:hypothetical protein
MGPCICSAIGTAGVSIDGMSSSIGLLTWIRQNWKFCVLSLMVENRTNMCGLRISSFLFIFSCGDSDS